MKRETIIAIFFGMIFGAILAFVLLVKNKEFQLSKLKTLAPSGRVNQALKASPAAMKSFEILEPQDGVVVDKDVITIKGKAEKNSLLVIQSPTKDMVFKNAKEQFSLNFPLALGENVIKITLQPKDGQARQQEKELRIYYLTEGL